MVAGIEHPMTVPGTGAQYPTAQRSGILSLAIVLLLILPVLPSTLGDHDIDFSVEVTPDTQEGQPGDTLDYLANVTNNASAEQDIRLEVSVYYGPGFSIDFPEGENFTVAGYSNHVIPFEITINQSAFEGEKELTVRVLIDDELAAGSNQFFHVFYPPPNLRLELTPEELEITRGETGEYTIHVHNDGEIQERVHLSATAFGDRKIVFGNDSEIPRQRNVTIPVGGTWEGKIHLPTDAVETNVNQTSSETITVVLWVRLPYDDIRAESLFIVHTPATEDPNAGPSIRPALSIQADKTRYTMEPGERRDLPFEIRSNATEPGTIDLTTETAPFLDASIVEGDRHPLESHRPKTLHAQITVAEDAPPGPQSTTLHAVMESGHTQRLTLTIHVAPADDPVEPLPVTTPFALILPLMLALLFLRRKAAL